MKISNKIQSFAIEHHGIVMGLIKRTRLIEILDKHLPKRPLDNVNVSNGQVVAALILSGLGFSQRRLYNLELFLRNLPVDKLFGKDIRPEHFNDDVVGGCLDSIYKFGVTKLYAIISFTIGIKFKLFTEFKHLDSTTMVLFGDYIDQPSPNPEIQEDDKVEATITFGHSKDHRPDLKQVTYSLVCMGKNKLPVWFEPLPGNKSDKESFHNTISEFLKYQKDFHSDMPNIWVADSAFYNKKYLLRYDHTVKWISRVPETIKMSRMFTELPEELEKLNWEELENGYKVFAVNHDYGGVIQRWILVSSEKARKRELEIFDSKLNKDEATIAKKVARAQSKKDMNSSKAMEIIEELRSSFKYHSFKYRLKSAYKELKKIAKSTGQPYKKYDGQRIVISVSRNERLIEEKRVSKGRFVLATNEMDNEVLSSEEVLTQYKNQTGTVESNFKLLKDKAFLLNEIYLKNATRIVALLMVLALTLFIYGLGEYWLREQMEKRKVSLKTFDNRKIARPTLKKVFQMMSGVTILSINIRGKNEKVLTNFNDQHYKILQLFGTEVLSSYGFT